MSFVIILSPAKKLAETAELPHGFDGTNPILQSKAKQLHDILKKKSVQEIQSLMSLSDKLAGLNYQRYQNFDKNQHLMPAILMFQGDTYIGLNAHLLDDAGFKSAQESLIILSGLYGMLRAFDMIQPYRLEMGTSLNNPMGKNLYDFWGDEVTEQINQFAHDHDKQYIANLASNEYFSAIDTKKLNLPIITCDFKQYKNGDYKGFGMMTKRFRGMMANYIITQNAKTKDDLKNFSEYDFTFNADLSHDNKLVFVK